MAAATRILSFLSFFLVCVVLAASPWFFAAWEMWWFWPFAVCIFLATAFFALRLLLTGRTDADVRYSDRGLLAAVGCVPFLLYAAVRFAQAEVTMDAERSFLLFLTPFLLAVVVAFGAGRAQLKWLSALLLANLAALGLYGIINHLVTGSAKVLWMPGYPQYYTDGRASGTYYCPDHFAGLMELAFCLGLARLLARETPWHGRIAAAALLGISGTAVWLTKSRGGGLTLGIVLVVAFVFGFSQWRGATRWLLRAGVGAAVAGACVAAAFVERGYVARFVNYPWSQIEQSDRYQMASGALRAWRTAPVFGSGPGMHQNLWPHFAASEDGDRDTGKWPRFPNSGFHSYEAHNDWVQLLEEYGIVGLVLFLVGVWTTLHALFAGRRHALARLKKRLQNTPHYWTLLGGLFAAAAMGFHSLGDFNLQMPATTWILAAILAIPIAHLAREG